MVAQLSQRALNLDLGWQQARHHADILVRLLGAHGRQSFFPALVPVGIEVAEEVLLKLVTAAAGSSGIARTEAPALVPVTHPLIHRRFGRVGK
jgi:hypothetical protein